jgi:hypothetical protein
MVGRGGSRQRIDADWEPVPIAKIWLHLVKARPVNNRRLSEIIS